MRCVCWIANAANTHTEYAIYTAFPRQQWLRERVTSYVIRTLLVLLNASVSIYINTSVLTNQIIILTSDSFLLSQCILRLSLSELNVFRAIPFTFIPCLYFYYTNIQFSL